MDNEHYKILLIEDNPDAASMVREMLAYASEVSFDVECADQLPVGLERLGSDEFDTVLLDLDLRNSQGLDALSNIRARAPHVPIVVLTGIEDDSAGMEAVRAGAQDYIIKGWTDSNVLSRAIRYAIERKRAEKALGASEARFRSIIQQNADAIIVTDRDGVVRYVNPAALSLFGVGKEKLLDQQFGLSVVVGEEIEVDIASEGGEPTIAEMRAAETEWEGEPVQIVSLRDVTQRNRMLEELDRNRRRELEVKDQFISHVSHELRSPLAAIYEFVTILLDGLAGEIPGTQREHLTTILRNVNQLKTMIDDLLDISRAQTGKLTVQPRYLRVSEHVRRPIESCGGSASAKDIDLSAEVPDDLPPAYADGQRVQQIVTNLINNAIKFTPESGSVTVRAGIDENDPDFLCVSVSDTGCGVSDENRERIFEQMFQVQYNGDAGRKGLGLGLYICTELVSQHGGRIWVESERYHGSTFFFTLPVFSLAQSVGPILTKGNLLRGSMALITVDVASTDDRSLGKLEEAAMEGVWDILDRCIIRAMDVVLPRMPRRKTGETFYVAACVDEGGTESLVQRIRQQLAGYDTLRTAGLAATVSTIMMDVPSLPNDEPLEEIAKDIASKIEELVMTPV